MGRPGCNPGVAFFMEWPYIMGRDTEMGTADSLSKQFLSNNDVFAEVCNLLYHHGRPVVRPDSLRELSPCEARMLESGHALGRVRDILKSCAGKASSDGSIEVLLGLEAQTGVDYSMPERVLLYDVLRYDAQIEELSRRRRKTGGEGWSPVSRMGPGDRLTPVRTAVIYFGMEPWSGPRRLGELLRLPDGGDWPAETFFDYEMRVLSLCELTDRETEAVSPELRCVARCLRNSGHRQDIAEMLAGDPSFACVPATVMPLIQKLLNLKIRINDTQEETVNMSNAWVEWLDETRAEGKAEGRAEGMAEGELKGRAEGRAEGRGAERDSNIRSMIRTMRRKHEADAQIREMLCDVFSMKEEEAKAYL